MAHRRRCPQTVNAAELALVEATPRERWAALAAEAEWLESRTDEELEADLVDAEVVELRVRPGARAYTWRDGRLVPLEHDPVPGLTTVLRSSGWVGPYCWAT